jgi:maltose O-acetyltransferase
MNGPGATASDAQGWLARLRARYAHALSGRWLSRCNAVGARPFLRGAPFIYTEGRIVIGDDFAMSSTPVQSHLFVTGSLAIGDRVQIGAGAAISCMGTVEIADDAKIGAFVILLDSNFHETGDFAAKAVPKPIRIGKGARVGHRTVILPGSTIGDGAVVRPGSVVSGDVPAGATVEGNPARIVGADGSAGEAPAAGAEDIPQLVMRVLGLPKVPDVSAGPEQIPQWDSLGALRILVAVEESFGVAVGDEQLRTARSIRELMAHVERAMDNGAAGQGEELSALR